MFKLVNYVVSDHARARFYSRVLGQKGDGWMSRRGEIDQIIKQYLPNQVLEAKTLKLKIQGFEFVFRSGVLTTIMKGRKHA